MKIRARMYPNGQRRWLVDLGSVRGKRERQVFASKVEAEAYLAAAKTKRREEGMLGMSMGKEDALELIECRERLAPLGMTLRQAVDYVVGRVKVNRQTMPLPDLLDGFLRDKQKEGARELYVRMLRSTLGGFVAAHAEAKLSEIGPEEVKGYLERQSWSPKTQKNMVGNLRAFWGWLLDQGEIEGNSLKELKVNGAGGEKPQVGAFGPVECRALLRASLMPEHRRLMGFLTLALFAGIRPEEIRRASVAELDLRERVFVVEGKHAKTRSRRVLELHPVAVVWLRLWRMWCPRQSAFVETNHKKRFARLRDSAGVDEWPHDALRHTFASMHLAAFQDVPRLQYLMGHYKGEDTLFAHYRATQTTSGERISKKLAEEFWRLTPKGVGTEGDMSTSKNVKAGIRV